jgi:transketolase
MLASETTSSYSTRIAVRLHRSRAELPERFIECGIAEQHMVSAAGGMRCAVCCPWPLFALSRLVPTAIYNNATEGKIIRTAALAGSRIRPPDQSVRDISRRSVPGLTITEPQQRARARLAIRWASNGTPEHYLRFVNVPLISRTKPPLCPGGWRVSLAQALRRLVGYGPVLLMPRGRQPTSSRHGESMRRSSSAWLNRGRGLLGFSRTSDDHPRQSLRSSVRV